MCTRFFGYSYVGPIRIDATGRSDMFAGCVSDCSANSLLLFVLQGIGLCRTEHMFFASEERIATVRRMIVAQVRSGGSVGGVYLCTVMYL